MLASTPTLSLIQGNALPLAARGRDTTLPIVSITAPQNNSIVDTTSTSAPLTIKATATDDRSRIASVKFYVDNSTTPIVTDTRSPYSFTWPTQNVSGTHTFKAVAQDRSGKVSTPAVVSVTFVNVAPVTATHLAIATPTSATAGTSFSVTVTALNASNQTVTGYTGTVHFTSSDSQVAGLPANYTFTAAAGVHTFTGLTLKTAGSQTVTATDTVTSTITGSATVTVSPATRPPPT